MEWGLVDRSIFVPMQGYTETNFNQEVFNLVFHLKQQWSDVMSWPSSVRVAMWEMFLEQRKFDEKALQDRSRG